MFIRSTQVYTVYHVHSPQSVWRPLTDVYETDTEMVVEIEIAGMRDGHFHLNVQDQTLIIYGTRPAPARQRRAYHQMEVNSGDFRVELDLRTPIEPTLMQADYDDGFLRIRLPKIN